MESPAPNYSDLLMSMGLVSLIIGLVIYLAVLALMLWVGYLIIKAAVRNGLREHTMWLEARRGPLR
jgi:type IV secretory pathway VirB3-like protein